jgi:hypothetical protein
MAARNLAIVHTAIYEAVNAIFGTNAHYLAEIKPLPGASAEVAAAAAAHRALIELYPRLRTTLDKGFADSLAEVPEGYAKDCGKNLGRFTAERILAWRREDGMERKATYVPQAAPGVWQRTPPDFAQPLLPQWPSLAPFAMDRSTRLHPKDPPRLNEPAYTTSFNEVKDLGAANSKTRSREQTDW